jgi:hypothetical protein
MSNIYWTYVIFQYQCLGGGGIFSSVILKKKLLRFFSKFFNILKLMKNPLGKTLKLQLLFLVRHCNTQCTFTKPTWFEWKIQYTYHKQPTSWELNFDLKGLAHPLWRNWNLNPWNKGILHPTHLKVIACSTSTINSTCTTSSSIRKQWA